MDKILLIKLEKYWVIQLIFKDKDLMEINFSLMIKMSDKWEDQNL